jgi:hypothetical protein
MNAARPKARQPAVIIDHGRGAARAHPYLAATAETIGALALSAWVNRHLAQKAVRDNPPQGQFLEINGVRLHYIERGAGEPLVLLHGNGSMIQDFDVVQSTFHRVPETGHMVHQTATGTVMSAINEVAREAAGTVQG